MLRASTAETNTDIGVVREGAGRDDGTVPEAAALLALAEAIHDRDQGRIDAAREAIAGALGPDAAVDSIAVCAQFEAITRVADTTGVQLDTALEKSSAGIRDQLGLNAFDTTVEAKG